MSTQASRSRSLGRRTLASFAVIALAGPAQAVPVSPDGLAEATGLELGGQVRLRGEIDARDFDGETNPDGVVSSRVRFDIRVAPTEDLQAFIQIQDVRVFGEEENTLTDADADGLDLHQGYLGIDDFFGSGVDVRAGRQEVNFGEQRLVGAVDWTQNARSFDGIRLDTVLGGDVTLTPFAFILDENDAIAAGGRLRQADPSVDEARDDDARFFGVNGVWRIADGVTAEPHVYWLNNAGADIDRWTLGVYGHGSVDLDEDLALLWNATVDYQTGDLADDVDIDALLFAAHVGVRTAAFTATIGYDLLSGDDSPGDGTSHTFDTLFATNHKFYGHMDYFLSASDTAGLGLQDLVLRASAPIVDDTSVGVELHSFWTAATDERRDVAREDRLLGGSDDLGEEIDLWIKHRYNSALGLTVGYSAFFPGEAIRARFQAADAAADREVRPHGAVAHWAYLMADLRF